MNCVKCNDPSEPGMRRGIPCHSLPFDCMSQVMSHLENANPDCDCKVCQQYDADQSSQEEWETTHTPGLPDPRMKFKDWVDPKFTDYSNATSPTGEVN